MTKHRTGSRQEWLAARLELLKADPEVSAALSAQELEERFNLDYHFKAVDRIFERVFG